MKITKRQLRRIIREEKVKLLNEQPVDQNISSGIYEAVWTLIEDEAMYTELDLQDGPTVMGIVKALEMVTRELKDNLRGPTR